MSDAERKLINKYLESPEVLADWGISRAHRYSNIFAVAHTALLALMLGTASFFLAANSIAATSFEVRWFVVGVCLMTAASFLRVLQLKSEVDDLPGFCEELAVNFEGIEDQDNMVILLLEKGYPWKSRHMRVVEHMIGIASIVLLVADMCQTGMADPTRSAVFYLAVLTFIAGGCWMRYTFQEALSVAELEMRCKAALLRRRKSKQIADKL